MRRLCGLLASLAIAGACAGTGGPTSPPPTAAPPGTPPVTASPEPTPSARLTPLPSVTGSGVTIFDETSGAPDASAQEELVTEAGRHIFIDTVVSTRFSRAPTADDVLLITHLHADHVDSFIIDRFPGHKLIAETGTLVLPDVTVASIPAAHTPGDPTSDPGATDHILVISVGGLRIVHFGDLGEPLLTDDQMAIIGRVDVAFSQLENPYSDMPAGSTMGFDQMTQVDPRIFVPTHMWDDQALAEQAAATWPALYTLAPSIHLTPADLPTTTTTTMLLMGYNAQLYGEALHLEKASW
jgi:L-ascorbate metabolism protein UlaG (beta-lactamase superfamily)